MQERTVGTRASRPRRVCGGLRWRIASFPANEVCSVQLKMQSTQRSRDAEAQRFERHERRCKSVLWGRGRLARGGVTEECRGVCLRIVSFPAKEVCSVQLKMQSTQRRRDAEAQRFESHGGRCESVHCGDAGVSPAAGLRRVILPPLRGLFLFCLYRGLRCASPPSVILSPLRGLLAYP